MGILRGFSRGCSVGLTTSKKLPSTTCKAHGGMLILQPVFMEAGERRNWKDFADQSHWSLNPKPLNP